ncbi:hypothetical protein Nepgr_032558 [Nepenthes gracilis]|uniref:RecQ mediated genome instability protein 1 OB-fold domain-containing protein n=1 Tax=Nepenthes gracilis TaxID=150966 RepID=A0AAD3TJH0_NEPGR|nr:hypothetical protein Nepgr_032558 [Nepenthes gracilis]
MADSSTSISVSHERLLQSLTSRGWCFGDLDQVKALLIVYSALHDDAGSVDAVESELCNMDLKSFGGKGLPDPSILRNSSHLHPPKVLQISFVKDVSRSSFSDDSRSSSNRRLLKMILTDGHTEINAIEYSYISSFPDDVVPGTKVRLEKKAMVHSGIVCLSPDVVTVLGGVVKHLYEEWQMNQKYSGFSRSSSRLVQEGGATGPPPFERLQIGGPKRGSAQNASGSYGRRLVESHKDVESKLMGREQAPDFKADNLDNSLETASISQPTEEKPSSSETRQKEVAEYAPVHNQAAAQKLLQKMSNPTQKYQRNRHQKYKGKGKEEEKPVFTLDEWERRKAWAMPLARDDPLDANRDEDLAWKLQHQFDLEDQVQRNHHQEASENLKMSMFSFERDGGFDGRANSSGSGRGRARRGGRRRGRGRV